MHKKIIGNTTRCVHMSLYFAVITIDASVVFGANRMRSIMLSVFRLLKKASKCARLGNYKQKRKAVRKVNGNMDNVKYQSDIIHDNEQTCNCAVFQQKDYICMHLRPCHN